MKRIVSSHNIMCGFNITYGAENCTLSTAKDYSSYASVS